MWRPEPPSATWSWCWCSSFMLVTIILSNPGCYYIYTCFGFVFFKTVNQLAMETRMVMKGNHSRKTAAFVRVSPCLTTPTEEKELCVFNCHPVFFFFRPGVCRLQFHHHSVAQQHLQPPQPLSVVWPGCFGKPVPLSG